VAQKTRAKLMPVALADDIAAARVLRDLVQPPEGMMTGDLSARRAACLCYRRQRSRCRASAR
jgi:hypothetical protein